MTWSRCSIRSRRSTKCEMQCGGGGRTTIRPLRWSPQAPPRTPSTHFSFPSTVLHAALSDLRLDFDGMRSARAGAAGRSDKAAAVLRTVEGERKGWGGCGRGGEKLLSSTRRLNPKGGLIWFSRPSCIAFVSCIPSFGKPRSKGSSIPSARPPANLACTLPAAFLNERTPPSTA